MAFQRNPDPILWLVRDDGTLLSMTYDPKQDVVAWARHYAGSSSTTSETRPTVNADYPRLRTTADQDDPALVQGTPIGNAEDLQNMSLGVTDNYYLTNDIDVSTLPSNWVPIGNGLTTWFEGTFDGKGYTISNLTIDRNTKYNGLFGAIRGTAKVYNVVMTGVDITGDDYSGAVAGHIVATATDEPVIQKCTSAGSIKAHASASAAYLGGLVGRAEGITASSKKVYIYDSSTSCTVDENSALVTSAHGGFVGEAVQLATIKNCYATGNVTGGNDTAGIGGFIGGMSTGADISYCYATGNVVNGESEAGGFVGYNNNASGTGIIEKCYSTGNVTNTGGGTPRNVGGFVGDNGNGGDIQNCYSWGDATSDQATVEVGGFCGEDDTGTATVFVNCYCIGTATGLSGPGGFIGEIASGTVTSCYWDTEASGNATSDAGSGKTTTQMKTESTYTDWDFDDIWYMLPLVQETVQSVRTESVAVIPSTSEDEVWVTCNRTINGSAVRYIERMKPRDWGDDMEDMFFVDSGLTYDGDSTSTITGLDHLEGETVAILADGAVQPSKTVSSGAITLTDAASVVQVGLPYTYKLKPMRMDQNTQQGTSKGSVKKITEAVISFYKTLNARYGDGTDTYDINWRETSAEYTTPPDLVTGDKVVVADGGFSVEDPFQIEGSDPMPCSIRAIIPRIEQTGR
jgi:hypothetical protein